MPYVPSEKTFPPATDRKVIDEALEPLAQRVTTTIVKNSDLRKEYRRVFIKIAKNLHLMLSEQNTKSSRFSTLEEWNLAKAIYETGEKYKYDGAELGEFNYAITRFIQRVPQIKVARGDWKDSDELRYWSYANATSALLYAAIHTEDLDIGLDGVFLDIWGEYKWKVNRPYEAAQIIKSGDCYDTPYYTRLVEIVDENGNVIGHTDIYLKRSPETINVDVLPGKLVLVTRPSEIPNWAQPFGDLDPIKQ